MGRLLLFCLVTGLALVGAAPAPVAAARHGAGERYVPGQLVVRFEPGVTARERTDARRDRGATVAEVLPLPRAQLLELEPGASPVAEAAAFERDARVAYAEPNWIYKAQSNDPLFGSLWGLDDLADTDIDAPEAWAAEVPGRGPVTVAVVDTGVTLAHPDLAGQLVPGHDFVDGDDVPADLDFGASHGTHVSGTVAALRDNGIGVAGVADQVRIMPLRALDWQGSGTNADVAAAFAYAGSHGAPVVNASLGGGYSQAIRDAIAAAPGTLFVVAAGNDARDDDANPVYPCAYPEANVLCVAASGRDDARASFSNWGRTSVDVAAPGVDTLSTSASFPRQLQELFEDGALPAGWTSQALAGQSAWEVTTDAASQGLASLAVAPRPYESAADTAIQVPAVDLSGRDGCQMLFDLRLDVPAGGGDVFRIESAPDAAGPWSPVFSRSEPTPGSGFSTYGADLPGGAPLHLRLRFSSDVTGSGAGPFVDWFELYCATPGYRSLSGTSMATPHVAGAAGLLLAQEPGLSVAQVKQRILSRGDVSACWSGLTATGRRLNLARTLGVDVPEGPTAARCGGAAAAEPGGAAPAPAPASEPAPAPAAPAPAPVRGPDPGGGAAGGAPRDHEPPALRAAAASVQRVRALRRFGLRARVACSEACSVGVRVYVRSRSRRLLLVGRASDAVTAAGHTTVRVRISRRGSAIMRHGGRRQLLVVSVTASDRAGNRSKLRRRLSLRS